jgi:hypothetical protein
MFVEVLEGFGIENVGTCILRPFGRFCGHWVYLRPFWYVLPGNIWQPRVVIHKIDTWKRLSVNCSKRQDFPTPGTETD